MAYEGSKTIPADKDSFLWMIDLLNEWQIDYRVEGGWGIDTLLGKQTREHRDIDLDFDASAEAELMEKLLELGYQIITDERPTRVELYHPEGGWFELEADWFSEAIFEGRMVPCVSVEGQRLFHSGYELRKIDIIDLDKLNDSYPVDNSQ